MQDHSLKKFGKRGEEKGREEKRTFSIPQGKEKGSERKKRGQEKEKGSGFFFGCEIRGKEERKGVRFLFRLRDQRKRNLTPFPLLEWVFL